MLNSKQPSSLYPWYVHLIGGWSLVGFFPWILLIRQYLQSGKKKVALALLLANLLVYCGFCLCGFLWSIAWDKLSLAAIIFTIIWSMSAWLIQYRHFGPAPSRYQLRCWRNLISPVLSAILLGMGLSVLYSIFPTISNHVQMYQNYDVLDKSLILRDLFHYVPLSLLFSIPIGLWWAGKNEPFSMARVLPYLAGLPLFYIILMGGSSLFFLLLNHGGTVATGFSWPVTPQHLQGLQKYLHFFSEQDPSTFFLIPLILGATPRVRDFFRKSLLYFPCITILYLGFFGFSHGFWNYMQDRMVYATSSDDPAERNRAFGQIQFLLKRYPNHQGWPVLATKLGHHYYLQGDTEKAKKIYVQLEEKSALSRRWNREQQLAAQVLTAAQFGDLSERSILPLPTISYESYLSSNWMSLLRVLRYYEQEERSESQTLIGLKYLSEKDSEISLPEMPTLAELDDAASALDYEVIYLHNELNSIRRFIAAGFPLILPIQDDFHLLYGVDEGRMMVIAASYHTTSTVAQGIKKEELGKTSLEDTASPSTQKNWARLSLLAEREIPFSFWQNKLQDYSAPYLAVVLPRQRKNDALALLETETATLINNSNAIISGLIGLSTLKSGDVLDAIEWAERSGTYGNEAISFHVAHLASLLYSSRDSMILSQLRIEDHFSALAAVKNSLVQPETATFLAAAEDRFSTDLQLGRLSWAIAVQYHDFLDKSQKDARRKAIALHQQAIEMNPSSQGDWLALAQLNLWNHDFAEAARGYAGALDSAEWDDAVAIQLSLLLLHTGKEQQAEELMQRISPSAVQFKPDYYYCLALCAEKQGKKGDARRNYEKAINIRKYNPAYHRSYAAFLEAQGESPEKVALLQQWADRIDARTK